MDDADYLMALELQREFEHEMELPEPKPASSKLPKILANRQEVKNESREKWKHRQNNADLDSTQNLVHPEWETLDPTPDVQSLFGAFDAKFFQRRLKCVTLEWSKRMYSCAGICYTHRNRLGMAITIRLSEPLLKLRSRKDLVETLLHEMIHAYCSVLGIREGNGGHGPNFKKIMHGINKVAGTNITVYHTFHDEVDMYKTHWWRCNGICQNRKPFFGYVKRTSNRAPGPSDIWWRQHLESCGGTYLKIREPERKKPKSEKQVKSKAIEPKNNIRTYFGNQNAGKGKVKSNGGGTIVINDDSKGKKNQDTTWMPAPTMGAYQGGVNKVIGFQDLTGSPGSGKTPNAAISATGKGYSLTTPSFNKSVTSTPVRNNSERDHVRNIWATKFSTSTKRPNESDDVQETGGKRRKVDATSTGTDKQLPSDNADELVDSWTAIDDEILLKDENLPVIDISSDDDDDVIESPEGASSSRPTDNRPVKTQTSEDRQRMIKQEILESSDTLFNEDDIELIDDDYNDDDVASVSAELADTSLIDDLFGEDTLLRNFKKNNAVVASNSRYHSDPKNDIVSCPVCQDSVTREMFSDHLDGCIGISVKVVAPSTKPKVVPSHKRKDKPHNSSTMTSDAVKRALREAGYNDDEIAGAVGANPSQSLSLNESDDGNRRRGLDTSTHACPVCGREVAVDMINEHLDMCLPDD